MPCTTISLGIDDIENILPEPKPEPKSGIDPIILIGIGGVVLIIILMR